jgi:hypothetical protein
MSVPPTTRTVSSAQPCRPRRHACGQQMLRGGSCPHLAGNCSPRHGLPEVSSCPLSVTIAPAWLMASRAPEPRPVPSPCRAACACSPRSLGEAAAGLSPSKERARAKEWIGRCAARVQRTGRPNLLTPGPGRRDMQDWNRDPKGMFFRPGSNGTEVPGQWEWPLCISLIYFKTIILTSRPSPFIAWSARKSSAVRPPNTMPR